MDKKERNANCEPYTRQKRESEMFKVCLSAYARMICKEILHTSK